MAVFPDRIVLKNSTDDLATIEAAIETGGTDEITQGELVLGIDTDTVTIFTKASDGSIITFAPGVASARAIVTPIEPTVGLNSVPLSEGDIWFKSDSSELYVYYAGAWVLTAGGGGGGGGGGPCDGILDGGNADDGTSNGVTCGDEGGTGDAVAFSRGDGGDFNAGTVATPFAMAVFGGGDTTNTTTDYPIEQQGVFDGGVA